jgi:phosphoribosylglycinamide formyltransferase-1
MAADKRLFRIGVLGSGRGSNMAAIADACKSGQIHGEVAVVLTDNPNAGILSLAQLRGIPAHYLPPGPFRTKLDPGSEQNYIDALCQARVDLVVLAGFMRIVKPCMLKAFPQRVINIHPALLPSFKGLEAWRQALEYGVKFTGCTVHFVDDGIDTGPIIAQQVVPVLDEDTPATLHERIQQAERVLFPSVVAALAAGRIVVRDRHAIWRGPAA